MQLLLFEFGIYRSYKAINILNLKIALKTKIWDRSLFYFGFARSFTESGSREFTFVLELFFIEILN